MKASGRLLRYALIGALAVVGVTVCFRMQPSARTTTTSSGVAIPGEHGVSSRPTINQAAVPQNSLPRTDVVRPDPLSPSIKLKLAQWHAVDTGDSETRDQLTKELIAFVTDSNAAEIAQALSTEELNTPFGLAALSRWLDLDPIGSADWVATRDDATESEALLVARKLLQDPATLSAFCDELSDTEWKQRFLSGAALEGLSKDPVGAIGLAQRMNAGADQTNVLQTVAYDWMTRDPVAASDWIVKVRDGTVREQLLAASAKAIAASDPDLAAGWMVAAIKSEGVLVDTALVVVETWVSQDPTQAANWVARFPAGSSRDAAVDLVVHRWMASDNTRAIAWIENLPERDAILARLKAEEAERARVASDPGQ